MPPILEEDIATHERYYAASACFLGSDHEQHGLALLAASLSRFERQCFKTTRWNDIRDWGDHFAARRSQIEWGAGWLRD